MTEGLVDRLASRCWFFCRKGLDRACIWGYSLRLANGREVSKVKISGFAAEY